MTNADSAYIGLNSSLYHTLNGEQISLLERTIWLRRVGRYREALTIYQDQLGSAGEVPVVVIEHGNTYLELREYGKLYRFVEGHLARLSEEDKAALDLPEWRLVAIMKAMVTVRHKGLVEPAAAELMRMHHWLREVPVADYTDVQVNCVWRYVLAYIFVKHSANFEAPECELIPKSNHGREPWQGLADLRHSLLNRGMARHANGLFKVEINRTKLTDRLRRWDEFLVVPDKLAHPRCQAHAQADLHLRRCEDYVSLHRLDLALQEVTACHAALDRMLTMPGVESEDDQYTRLHLQIVGLGFVAEQTQKLAQAEELLPKLRAKSHPNYATCLDLAAETAKEIYDSTGSRSHLSKFYELRGRHERLDELEHEDIVSLVGHQYDIFGPAISDRIDSQKCLEWIDGFLAKYPEFSAPSTMHNLYLNQAMLLAVLQRSQESIAAYEKAQHWADKAGNVTTLYHQSYSNLIAPGRGSVGGTDYDPEDEESGFSFGQAEIAAIQDKMQGAKLVVHSILDFAFEDLRNGRIKLENFEDLLGFDDDDRKAVQSGPDELLAQLKGANAVDLFALIFLPKATYTSKDDYNLTLEDEEREHALLDHRWAALHEWLSNPPRGQRNNRLFTLMILLEVRKQWLADSVLYDLRLKDFDRLLQVQESFPRMMKDFSDSWRGGWISSKAWLHYTKFVVCGNMDQAWQQVLKADECANHALQILRDSQQTTATGLISRLTAMLSLLKIRRLQQGKDPTKQDGPHGLDDDALALLIRQIRHDALEAVTETDQIFSASEQEASWEDGADGIRRRAQVAQTQQSYLTMQVGAQLVLCEPKIFTADEDPFLLWDLVQKFKARSLARSIGMFRPNPPGLVDRIMQSSGSGTYQRMIELQDSIEKAETKNRFHLRRELDTLRASMRKNPALKQLSDLREATAFSLEELDTIAEQVGQPFVVVEWFWVPAYWNNPPLNTDKGSIILLTSRPGRIVTVDVLNVDLLKMNSWIGEWMTARNARGKPRLSEPVALTQFNRSCGGLVAPMAERTARDELLVLCPTHELNKLPLHALEVDGDPLIHRNPIVYIHALSLMRSCHSAAQYAADAGSPLQPRILSGIDAPSDRRYTAGRQSVIDIAARLNVSPFVDECAAKGRFLEHATTSRLLHLHTHCHWDAADPLEHSLDFPDARKVATNPAAATESQLEQLPRHGLTAREIFSLHLQQGCHVNLIACSGGVLDLKVGDEPMGLVPALLYSGASSTVSTLWPIEDHAGAKFSRAFFDRLIDDAKKAAGAHVPPDHHRQADSGAERGAEEVAEQVQALTIHGDRHQHWIDLARAVQHAVLALDPDLDEPMLTWAGFILHGFWKIPIAPAESVAMTRGGQTVE